MAQPIRAAFFDIDGTLLTFGDRQMPDSTTRALRKMHDAGILLFISSGRPPFQLKRLPPIQAIPFDGFILTNGQFCADREMNPFFVRALPGESMPVLLGWLEQHPDVLCTFAEESYSYNNRPTSQAMTRRCLDCGVLPPNQPVEDPARALTHTTYQLNLYMPPEMDETFRQAVPGCRAVRWNDAFADIIPAEGGKAAGRLCHRPGGPGRHLERRHPFRADPGIILKSVMQSQTFRPRWGILRPSGAGSSSHNETQTA